MNIKAICYYYPPLNSSEGFSAYKLFIKSKYKINVISQKESSSWTYGNDNIKTKNVEYIEINNNWFKNVLDNINFEKNDIVITRSMPNYSHVLGIKILKKYKNIKWIAFFSDPYWNSPITKIENLNTLKKYFEEHRFYKMIVTYLKFSISNYLLKKSENKIFRKADYLVFNNEYLAQYMTKRFNNIAHKLKIIPHTYESSNELLNDAVLKINRNSKIVFSFLGNLSEVRNLNNYLKAIVRIKSNPEFCDKVEFIFVGCDKSLIEAIAPIAYITYIPLVSYNNSLEIMAKSDWLINSDANINNENYIYLPCKLIDYLSFTKNVINISNFEKSPTVEIVNQCGGTNIKDCESVIFDILVNIILSNTRKTRASENIKNYSSDNVAKEFDKMIEFIMRNKND